ncbi:hypothetical protein B0H21DRAFT_781014 [Amylocystis lapponica]|nr:hypothetical protein B0H21DRAFT_781014 [Amylocystis lapponica]
MPALTLRWELLSLISWACFAYAAFNVTLPGTAPDSNATVVYSTFLGISFELSYINDYFGNTTDEIPQPMLNYIAALKARSSAQPVKLRIGGNSMDSATYTQTQQAMIEFTGPGNSNDAAVAFGPVLFDVMQNISASVGGARYLIGLGLRDPNSTDLPLLAGDAYKTLGDSLDAYLLGNEPDLYAAHGNKPPNYGINDYIGDYYVAFENLENTSGGNVLSLNNIAGPTICCSWVRSHVGAQFRMVNDFADHLKYLTVQHYPQNNCFGSYQYQLNYYLAHSNAVTLAQWQAPALQQLAATPPASRKPLVMSEWNSASCGGIPGISDTFGATLWTADYALQLASVGYSNAFLHTRELGVSYNLFDYPAGANDTWTTNPPFYALLAVAEALEGTNGSVVVDLNVQNSMADPNASVAGYAVYDGSAARRASSRSRTGISPCGTGGALGAGVGDGVFSVPCTGGCSIQVPGPGLALVFIDPPPATNSSGNGTSGGNSGGGSNDSTWSLSLRLCVSALTVLLSC